MLHPFKLMIDSQFLVWDHAGQQKSLSTRSWPKIHNGANLHSIIRIGNVCCRNDQTAGSQPPNLSLVEIKAGFMHQNCFLNPPKKLSSCLTTAYHPISTCSNLLIWTLCSAALPPVITEQQCKHVIHHHWSTVGKQRDLLKAVHHIFADRSIFLKTLHTRVCKSKPISSNSNMERNDRNNCTREIPSRPKWCAGLESVRNLRVNVSLIIPLCIWTIMKETGHQWTAAAESNRNATQCCTWCNFVCNGIVGRIWTDTDK